MSLGNVEELKRTVRNIVKKFDYEKRELNQPLLKKLKDAIKRDAQLVPEFVDAIFANLRSQDSDKRLCVVLVVDYFFQRSHAFRTAIVDSLQDYLVYTVELDPLYFPLPGPPAAATLLKKETLDIFKLWVDKFKDGYPKLENAKTVLLASRTFNFARSDGQTEVERQRSEAERIRKEAVDKKIVDQVLLDYNDSKAHIRESIKEAQTIMSILIPDFREYNQNPQSPETPSSSSTAAPVVSDRNLIISVPDKIVVEKTEDNEEVIQSFKENQKILESNLKKVNDWTSKMTKHGGSGEILKELLDFQRSLNQQIRKIKDVKIVERRKAVIPKTAALDLSMEDSDDEEDGFEDVDLRIEDPEGMNLDKDAEKEGEISVEQELMEQVVEMEKRETLEKLKTKRKEAKKKEEKIPTLHYGLDLKYWGEEVVPAEIAKNKADGHPFWRPPDEDQVGKESEDIYRTRVITYVPELPEITRSCRAPLPSGRLCPRMDRVNCPLHGPIVNRDDNGNIVFENGQPSSSSATLTAIEKSCAEYEKRQKEAEEDALYRDLEVQTGGKFSYDLAKYGNKKKKDAPKKREKSAHQKTRDRLKSKLFNKGALKRVNETLVQIQQNKAAKKFAHQFNY